MAWCRQATSHFLNQCWPRSPTPYGITRHQCVLKQVPDMFLSYPGYQTMIVWSGWAVLTLDYEVFAGINIATINCKPSLVQLMAGHRVGGKPLSEPSINTLHKCIYIYTPSSLDLLQGALTHGDRQATESRDLSCFNIENKYCHAAFETVMKSILGQETPLVPLPENYSGNFLEGKRYSLL